jgi:hypothetical protein
VFRISKKELWIVCMQTKLILISNRITNLYLKLWELKHSLEVVGEKEWRRLWCVMHDWFRYLMLRSCWKRSRE